MTVQCPTCRKEAAWENNPYRPFCSDRCKMTDLGEWAMGKRSIPGDHAPADEEDSKKQDSKPPEDSED